jgi:hypothetical protein
VSWQIHALSISAEFNWDKNYERGGERKKGENVNQEEENRKDKGKTELEIVINAKGIKLKVKRVYKSCKYWHIARARKIQLGGVIWFSDRYIGLYNTAKRKCPCSVFVTTTGTYNPMRKLIICHQDISSSPDISGTSPVI